MTRIDVNLTMIFVIGRIALTRKVVNRESKIFFRLPSLTQQDGEMAGTNEYLLRFECIK